MRAWVVDQPGPIHEHPLRKVDREPPRPGQGEVLVDVKACGVCRTDLHLAEGDLPPHHAQTIPGHEIVGTVRELGSDCRQLSVGERVGIAWLRHTDGTCRFCLGGRENLCPNATFTGWDADGGYAEQAVVAESYAYRLPGHWSDETAAPLLCAGIIGYRALRLACLHLDGTRLGIYGFGASAHLAAQIALHEGARVHVMTRSPLAQKLALDIGCHSAGDTYDEPPERLDSAVIFAPVGDVVPAALAALDDAGTCAIAGIHLTDVPSLNYDKHLFRERALRSVTANTRSDGEAFLRLAARLHVRVHTQAYALDDADQALADVADDRVTGAAVLIP